MIGQTREQIDPGMAFFPANVVQRFCEGTDWRLRGQPYPAINFGHPEPRNCEST
jgi:hypothetical protein